MSARLAGFGGACAVQVHNAIGVAGAVAALPENQPLAG
jgi:hypothetical protein